MIVDANVLLYAVDSSSRFHEGTRGWLEDALNGPRAEADPLSPEESWEFVSDWLEAAPTWIPEPTRMHADICRRLMVDGDLRRTLVTDTYLAALPSNMVSECARRIPTSLASPESAGSTLCSPPLARAAGTLHQATQRIDTLDLFDAANRRR